VQDRTNPTPRGALTLADLAGRTEELAVACNRCERAGRYRLAKLTDRHGPALALPELLRLLSADCPKRAAPSAYDICGAHFPGLPGLFR